MGGVLDHVETQAYGSLIKVVKRTPNVPYHADVNSLVIRVTSQSDVGHRAYSAELSFWFLVGNGGMDYGDYYWGLYRDYYRDPFPHSLLSIRQYSAELFQTGVGFRASSRGCSTPVSETPKLKCESPCSPCPPEQATL